MLKPQPIGPSADNYIEYSGFIVSQVREGKVEKKHEHMGWQHISYCYTGATYQPINRMVQLSVRRFIHNADYDITGFDSDRRSVMILKLGEDFFMTEKEALERVIELEKQIVDFHEKAARGSQNRILDATKKLERVIAGNKVSDEDA